MNLEKKKKKEPKEKQMLRQENKKGWCSKTRENKKRKPLSFQKREKGIRAKTLFLRKKQEGKKNPEMQKFPNTCFRKRSYTEKTKERKGKHMW